MSAGTCELLEVPRPLSSELSVEAVAHGISKSSTLHHLDDAIRVTIVPSN